MPIDAEILTVQIQYGAPFIWAKVNPENGKEKRTFRIAGTGHGLEENNLIYIGTFQLEGGKFMGHLFEIKKEKK